MQNAGARIDQRFRFLGAHGDGKKGKAPGLNVL
jgi:hypothetical protein